MTVLLPILSTYSQLRRQVSRVLNLIASERDCGEIVLDNGPERWDCRTHSEQATGRG